MKIEWTAGDFEAAERARRAAPAVSGTITAEAQLGAAMSCAVSLFLARASGQVKEDRIAVSQALTRLETMTAKYETEATNALSLLSALAQEAASLRAKLAAIERRVRDDAKRT